MARTVTLTNLIAWVRSKGNWPSGNSFVTDTEITDELNAGIASLHRILATVHGYEYFRTTSTLTTVANVDTVSPPADFWKLLGLFWDPGTGRKTRISRYMPSESEDQYTGEGWTSSLVPSVTYSLTLSGIRFVPTPQAVHSVRMEYAQAPTKLVSGSDTWDGYAGYEEYPVWYAVATFKEKGEEDSTVAMGRLASIEANIRATASRDQSEPQRTQDLRGWPGRQRMAMGRYR